ncbi:MAG: phosphoribosylformylglycinamidine synthase subunit PurQ [Candidatus Hadarchaeales archaeon]
MKNVCVIRTRGTNCDWETALALKNVGLLAEIVHLRKLDGFKLRKYDALVIPGGFSYGDHIRAGAVMAKRLLARLRKELVKFVEEGKPILGICNGFQVLVEGGLLPAFEGPSEEPQAALAVNNSCRYECRWVYLRVEKSKCIFMSKVDKKTLFLPVAHAEGKFIFDLNRQDEDIKKLVQNKQLVLRYADESGRPAQGRYPHNPNGSIFDIAGVCDPSGVVFGLMPHPERAFYWFHRPDWTASKDEEWADGRLIFESLADYLRR